MLTNKRVLIVRALFLLRFLPKAEERRDMFSGSVVEYGVNGRDKRYGSNQYRGNTDGTIVKDFLDFCQGKFKSPVETCSDYMVGSGTTADVCKERGIGGT